MRSRDLQHLRSALTILLVSPETADSGFVDPIDRLAWDQARQVRHIASEQYLAALKRRYFPSHSRMALLTSDTHAHMQDASEQLEHAHKKEEGYSIMQTMLSTLGERPCRFASQSGTLHSIFG